MNGYYNRYLDLISDDVIISPPFVKLDEKETDGMIKYEVNKTRLDKVSEENYGVPYYGWLIMMANPELGGLEFNIIDGESIRIPLPLDATLKEYKRKLKQRLDYYGG
jgi:hypothetical protein